MEFNKTRLTIIKEKKCSYNSNQIKSSLDIVKFINSLEEYSYCDTEKLILICLDAKNKILSFSEIATGGMENVQVDIRNIFKNVLLANATKFILAHNHPSGDPTPSNEDVRFTAKVYEASKIMNIEFLDHIVIGDENYKSVMF